MPYLSPLPQTDILQSQPRLGEVSRGKIGRSAEFTSASGNLLSCNFPHQNAHSVEDRERYFNPSPLPI
jgi:hypothetical protein